MQLCNQTWNVFQFKLCQMFRSEMSAAPCQHLDLASCHWLLCACWGLQRRRQSAGTDKGTSVCPPPLLTCGKFPVSVAPRCLTARGGAQRRTCEADVNEHAGVHIYAFFFLKWYIL